MATYDQSHIVRYVDGELSEDEKRQFESDMQRDPVLQNEVALYQEVKASLERRVVPDKPGEDLRETLASLTPRYFQPHAKVVPLTRWLTGVAAAAIIGLVTVLLWPASRQDTIDRLGRTEMIGTTERGAGADSLLGQAAAYFNRQDFVHALPILDRAVTADSNSQLASFYRGVAAWKTGSTASARSDWQKVYNSESLLRFEAAFFMALSYASENNRPVALQWLSRIPESSPASRKAKELESKLK